MGLTTCDAANSDHIADRQVQATGSHRISDHWVDAVKAGADPSGRRDSSRAINAALLGAAGKAGVRIPPGTYLLTNPIAVPSHSALVAANGATFIQNTLTSLRNLDDTLGGPGNSDIRIEGGTFQIDASSAGSAHVRFVQVTNLRVSNITILGANGGDAQALVCQNVRDARIDRLCIDVYENGGGRRNNGIWIQGGRNVSIARCRVRSGDDAYAFGFSTTTGLPFMDTVNSSIDDCYGESRKGRVLDIESANEHSVRGIRASRITGRGGGLESINIANYSNGLSTTQDISVSNSTIDPSRTFVGVQVDGASGVDVRDVRLAKPVLEGTTRGRACFVAQTTAKRNARVSKVSFRDCSGVTESAHFGALQVHPASGGVADVILFERCRVRGGSYGVRLSAASGRITRSAVRHCEISADGQGSIGVSTTTGVSNCDFSYNRVRGVNVQDGVTGDGNRWIGNTVG